MNSTSIELINDMRYLNAYAKIADRQDWFTEQREKQAKREHQEYLNKQQEKKMRNINKFYARYGFKK